MRSRLVEQINMKTCAVNIGFIWRLSRRADGAAGSCGGKWTSNKLVDT